MRIIVEAEHAVEWRLAAAVDSQHWIVMPHQVRDRVARWQANRAIASSMQVEAMTQYTGEQVFAVTVTDPAAAPAPKRSVWVCVPHAHEPAGTAACMSVLQQLLTGQDVSGRPSQHGCQHILQHVVLTMLPDANPGGRCWAPVLWWDGSRYSNEEFWQWMRGVDAETGGMWQRVARWDRRQVSPLRRGIVYEQLNAHEFVEPNRDAGSTLVRLFARMNDAYHYDYFLELHQTEFEETDRNCELLLPLARSREGAVEGQAALMAWAHSIIAGWKSMAGVARPAEAPRSFPYLDDPESVSWFQEAWRTIDTGTRRLTVEIQNNSPRTPAGHQLALAEEAIWQTLELAAQQAGA